MTGSSWSTGSPATWSGWPQMPERTPSLPDFNAYVTIGQVITALFELEWLDLDDFADRDSARVLAERLDTVAPERQLTLALTA